MKRMSVLLVGQLQATNCMNNRLMESHGVVGEGEKRYLKKKMTDVYKSDENYKPTDSRISGNSKHKNMKKTTPKHTLQPYCLKPMMKRKI